MQPLDKILRNSLERTVKEARQIAESAARAALEQLGVERAEPYGHMSEKEQDLRRRLRIHGRQLGDNLIPQTKTQGIYRLVEEVAYEHWHRMLFARFLAENNLLMYPDLDAPVSVTLDECQDLAAEEGVKNGWELAARFAARMLPQIFRPDSPVFELVLPPENQQKMERLLDELHSDVFIAADSLGWVYQFWQVKRKEEVNASEKKIGARELPAVTQLFTEPYMVDFLLDNSLGAWWVGQRLSEQNLRDAQSEEELREKASLPGVPLRFLRFVKDENTGWRPAAGTFEQWPRHLKDFKVLDPSCGSGHFLVAAFLMLVNIRMELEGISESDACDAVIRDNLHGLELDKRCVELAAFAMALTAWKLPNAGGYRELPELHIACSGLAVGVSLTEWKKLALDNHNLRVALKWIHEEFLNAPTLGSLINPTKNRASKLQDWETLGPLLEEALIREKTDEAHEIGVVAQGLAKAAQLLAGKYHWVITNVPYLAIRKQSDKLRQFCQNHYNDAKYDLATVFLDRCLEFCAEHGNVSVVLPQNWLFLTSYKKFREKLLRDDTWHLIARLGAGAFDTISGEIVKAILLIISKGQTTISGTGLFIKENDVDLNVIHGIDVAVISSANDKASLLTTAQIQQVVQQNQLKNPDARISLDKSSDLPLLSTYAECFAGVLNGDSPRFQKKFWEIPERYDLWTFQQTTIDQTKAFGGFELILYFDMKNGHIRETKRFRREKLHDADQRGNRAWGKWGIGVSQMNNLPISLYTGETFDSNVGIISPKNQDLVLPIWTFCQTEEYNIEVRKIDQSLKVTNSTLVKIPFDLKRWQKVAAEKYPNGLPKPYSDDPTQWIFHGHPAKSEQPLQVAVARLLGYRWPAETDEKMELSDEARTLVKKCDDLFPLADADGIVCIPPVRGESPAADCLLNLLVTAYDSEWNNNKLSEFLKQVDHEGKSLETWLREKFFIQHCKLFHHRPFIWHIWDGLRDGFAVLVNYHKLDKKLLETLIYNYLGDWINRQKDDIAAGIDGAEERLTAAENLKKKLELIHKGESPHDIFIRWKPLNQQPIGWEPDINDGVRVNIRPFITVPPVSRKDAGVLRDKPNINWNKDRGKDVSSAPWFHLFNGDRINNHHLTLSEKQASRSNQEKETADE